MNMGWSKGMSLSHEGTAVYYQSDEEANHCVLGLWVCCEAKSTCGV